MPRTRQIKHDFFLNEELAALPALTRLLYVGLWLLADRAGRLEDRPAKIKAQIFPYAPEVDLNGMLMELAAYKHIVRYKVGGDSYIQIPKFTKHQHIHPDEKASVIPAPEISGDAGESPGISGHVLKSPEIMPSSSSPSSSPSPSSLTTGLRPDGFKGEIQKLAVKLGSPVEVRFDDYSDYRLPEHFGKYARAHVVNVPVDECEFILKTMKPGPKVRSALEWRINLKKQESSR